MYRRRNDIGPRHKTKSAIADDLVALVTASLDDDKAADIVVIDLRGKSSMADHMIIATGNSSRQVGAMAGHLVEKLKAVGLRVGIEGMPQCDWVLLDGADIIVHLFRPEVRAFYNLEKMWGGPVAALASPA